MQKVLIVDDNKSILDMLSKELKKHKNIEPLFAVSYQEAIDLLKKYGTKIHSSILELNLPDAPKGEIVALVNSYDIPAVILKGKSDKAIKEMILECDVADIVLKEEPNSVPFAVNALVRTLHYYETTVLVVDDSAVFRNELVQMLKGLHLNVIEAKNGQEGYEKVRDKGNNISLVITDYVMPVMDGLELLIKLREYKNKSELGIIVMSSIKDDKEEVFTRFLKFGANDILRKPFSPNAVLTRLNANIELLEMFKQIQELANKDSLTGLYNRRFFYDSGKAIFKKAKRKQTPIAVAMLDIDNFKSINDEYGHDIGDLALAQVPTILEKNLRTSDMMARIGGEEFSVLVEDITPEQTLRLFEKIRSSFEKNVIYLGDETLTYTVSIGIQYGIMNSFEEMIKHADTAMYEMKRQGKNQVRMNQN